MKRRLNYTGRKRINQDRITVRVKRDDEKFESFVAFIDLEGMELDPASEVVVEVHHRTEFERFHLGRVRDSIEGRRSLGSIGYTENLRFRVLVVNDDGMILASAEGISPEEAPERTSILPVTLDDLGQEVWRVEHGENKPELVINNRLPDPEGMVTSDPQFILSAHPAVIREVLTHLVFVEDISDPDNPTQNWHYYWITFAKDVVGAEPPVTLDPGDHNVNVDELLDWIDRVAERYADKRNRVWTELEVEI